MIADVVVAFQFQLVRLKCYSDSELDKMSEEFQFQLVRLKSKRGCNTATVTLISIPTGSIKILGD